LFPFLVASEYSHMSRLHIDVSQANLRMLILLYGVLEDLRKESVAFVEGWEV